MSKFLAALFGTAVALVLGFCVMWFGWGLRPVSWGWVIWGSIGSVFVGAAVQVAAGDQR